MEYVNYLINYLCFIYMYELMATYIKWKLIWQGAVPNIIRFCYGQVLM